MEHRKLVEQPLNVESKKKKRRSFHNKQRPREFHVLWLIILSILSAIYKTLTTDCNYPLVQSQQSQCPGKYSS